MVESVLAYDTSVEIRDREATTASPVVFHQLAWFPRSSHEGTVPWVLQNLRGSILKWQEQRLNLDFDPQHRRDFFSSADSSKAFIDKVEEEITPRTGYELEQLCISDSLPTWEQRFKQLRQLPENWDSYGAPRISDKAIEKGRSILTVLMAAGFSQQFFVAPSPNGGIEIEWELPGKELALEIPPTGEPITYLLVETTTTGEDHEAEEATLEMEGLEQLLQRISA